MPTLFAPVRDTAIGVISTNGTTWTPVAMPLSGWWTSATFDGTYYYAVCADTTLYRTADFINWTTHSLPEWCTYIVALQGALYMSSNDYGGTIQVSTDHGETWTQVHSQATERLVGSGGYVYGYDLAYDQIRSFGHGTFSVVGASSNVIGDTDDGSGAFYLGNNTAIVTSRYSEAKNGRSVDHGATWVENITNAEGWALGFIVRVGDKLIALDSSQRRHVSTDFGVTWVGPDLPYATFDIYKLVYFEGKLIAFGWPGIKISTDEGLTWSDTDFNTATGLADATLVAVAAPEIKTGKLCAWGANWSGRLGTGDTTARTSPTEIGVSEWLSVEGGGSFSLGISSDGKLFAWGENSTGQLGTGDTSGKTSPTEVNSSNWLIVSAGGSHSLGIRVDGKLFAWGDNQYGRVGDGSTNQRNSPVQIGTSNWFRVSAGSAHSLGIRFDGKLFAWGFGNSGRLGDDTTLSRLAPIQIGTSDWLSVSAGGNHSLGIRSDGKLFGWGTNTSGQVGDNTTTNKFSPTQIGTSNWLSVSAGGNHSLAIRSDGKLFAWGVNGSGQLGDGTTTQRNAPVQIGDSDWLSIDAGSSHSLGIRSDGKLFAWGMNSDSQLGEGGTDNKFSPMQIGDSDWLIVAAGTSHSLGIKAIPPVPPPPPPPPALFWTSFINTYEVT